MYFMLSALVPTVPRWNLRPRGARAAGLSFTPLIFALQRLREQAEQNVPNCEGLNEKKMFYIFFSNCHNTSQNS